MKHEAIKQSIGAGSQDWNVLWAGAHFWVGGSRSVSPSGKREAMQVLAFGKGCTNLDKKERVSPTTGLEIREVPSLSTRVTKAKKIQKTFL